jgi:hypothetical protein
MRIVERRAAACERLPTTSRGVSPTPTTASTSGTGFDSQAFVAPVPGATHLVAGRLMGGTGIDRGQHCGRRRWPRGERHGRNRVAANHVH